MGDHEQLDPEIAAHYASVSEQQRLGPWSPECVRTWELLGRHLPPPPAVVLDVGGAAGVYALPLAAQGYQVHLVDPLARHVQQALRVSAEQPNGTLASGPRSYGRGHDVAACAGSRCGSSLTRWPPRAGSSETEELVVAQAVQGQRAHRAGCFRA